MGLFAISLAVAIITICPSTTISHSNFGEFQEGVESLYETLQNVIPLMQSMVQQTLDNIPETDEYGRYQKELHAYLKDVENYKTKRGLCMEKTLRVYTHFEKFEERCRKDNAPAEAKKVLNLFNENGYGNIQNVFSEWSTKYGQAEILAYLHDPDTTDSIRMMPMALKVC
ncbi:uncharacterized protein LOC106081639 [Stomoxys calcitrans]|uniref:Uncharacterized protein n=1 Tax=Stomoxys calcitrans TaxID=35570 RepID=A0A1I8PXM8_STOCA|nr:uncharacterized protein LOC106081639 [Stomoxys calcitrans]